MLSESTYTSVSIAILTFTKNVSVVGRIIAVIKECFRCMPCTFGKILVLKFLQVLYCIMVGHCTIRFWKYSCRCEMTNCTFKLSKAVDSNCDNFSLRRNCFNASKESSNKPESLLL